MLNERSMHKHENRESLAIASILENLWSVKWFALTTLLFLSFFLLLLRFPFNRTPKWRWCIYMPFKRFRFSHIFFRWHLARALTPFPLWFISKSFHLDWQQFIGPSHIVLHIMKWKPLTTQFMNSFWLSTSFAIQCSHFFFHWSNAPSRLIEGWGRYP